MRWFTTWLALTTVAAGCGSAQAPRVTAAQEPTRLDAPRREIVCNPTETDHELREVVVRGPCGDDQVEWLSPGAMIRLSVYHDECGEFGGSEQTVHITYTGQERIEWGIWWSGGVEVNGEVATFDLTGMSPATLERLAETHGGRLRTLNVRNLESLTPELVETLHRLGGPELSLALEFQWEGSTDLGALRGLEDKLVGLAVDGGQSFDLTHLPPLSRLAALTLDVNETRGIPHLATFPELRSLTLGRISLAEADRQALGRLTRLNELDVSVAFYGDNSLLPYLDGLRDLRVLRVRDREAGDEGLAAIAGLTNLQLLEYAGEITEAQIDTLFSLCNLRWLAIRLSEVSAVGLEGFRGLERIRGLVVYNRDGADPIIAALDQLDGLESLGFRGVIIEGERLVALARRPGLERLLLLESQVDDADLVHLTGLTDLRWLSLASRYRRFTDAGLEHLASLEGLEVLELANSGVTDAGLEHLAGLRRLRRLNLSGTEVTGEGLRHLAGLGALEELDLDFTRLGNQAAAHLGQLTSLRELEVNGCGLDAGALAQLGNLTNLRALDLGDVDVDDEAMVHLGRLTDLRELDLTFSRGVTDAGLTHLAGLDLLWRLDLASADVTNAGVARLAELDRLQDLSLARTNVTEGITTVLAGIGSINGVYLCGISLDELYPEVDPSVPYHIEPSCPSAP